MTDSFLGRGWKFPIDWYVEEQDGEEKRVHVAVEQDEEKVRESIEIILCTIPGERLMHPDFGCQIHDLVFAPNNARTAGLIQFYVEEALTRWEPRIELEQVEVQQDAKNPEKLLISIFYRVQAVDSLNNLVYPFYLNRGEIL